MLIPDTTAAPSIRSMMPEGFLKMLAESTGCRQRATLSGIVTYETTSSKYWPAIEALAQETDPEGFARWQAAQAHTHAA
ncbi:hypothetical protein [Hymenobacter sediminicola]|uniref:Uncharacterized protein n=1 Tax=Hymenobacter sediminicola TaxID=2761579 RepID=A0A7G7W2X3_9BACT|nr:hypothetical protein [Hymenobacter sediminicola]QNH60716.1 hypothetical protein H4317_10985 [Hymenobacter sediminicola]